MERRGRGYTYIGICFQIEHYTTHTTHTQHTHIKHTRTRTLTKHTHTHTHTHPHMHTHTHTHTHTHCTHIRSTQSVGEESEGSAFIIFHVAVH